MKYLVLGTNRNGTTCSFIYEPESLDNPEIVGKEIEEKFNANSFYPSKIVLIPLGNGEMITLGFPDNGCMWSFGYNNSHTHF